MVVHANNLSIQETKKDHMFEASLGYIAWLLSQETNGELNR